MSSASRKAVRSSGVVSSISRRSLRASSGVRPSNTSRSASRPISAGVRRGSVSPTVEIMNLSSFSEPRQNSSIKALSSANTPRLLAGEGSR